MKRSMSCSSLEDALQQASQTLESLTGKTALWSQLLTKIVSPEQHGTKKDPATSWKTYLSSLAGEEIEECPVTLDVPDLEFEKVIIQISAHIGLCEKEKGVQELKVKKLEQKVEKGNKNMLKQERKAKERADKLIDPEQKKAFEEGEANKRTL